MQIIVTIKHIDDRTWRRARSAALKAGIGVGPWVCQAIREKLSRKKGERKNV